MKIHYPFFGPSDSGYAGERMCVAAFVIGAVLLAIGVVLLIATL